jgi:TPR repeat protein
MPKKHPTRSLASRLAPLCVALSLATASANPPPAPPLQARAEAGDAEAQFDLAKSLEPAAPDRAAAWYAKAADAGNIKAMNNLALLLFEGRGLPADAPKALALLRRAADTGSPRAQFNLAAELLSGSRTPKDAPAAAALLKKAADQGLLDAQVLYGNLMLAGDSLLPPDFAEAARALRAAADQGDVSAINSLGVLYDEGKGAPEDPAKAASLFEKAAMAGLAKAQYNLAHLHLFNRGVRADLVEAYAWLTLAAEGGAPAGKALLNQTRSGLTPEQRSQGQRRAAELRDAIARSKGSAAPPPAQPEDPPSLTSPRS